MWQQTSLIHARQAPPCGKFHKPLRYQRRLLSDGGGRRRLFEARPEPKRLVNISGRCVGWTQPNRRPSAPCRQSIATDRARTATRSFSCSAYRQSFLYLRYRFGISGASNVHARGAKARRKATRLAEGRASNEETLLFSSCW